MSATQDREAALAAARSHAELYFRVSHARGCDFYRVELRAQAVAYSAANDVALALVTRMREQQKARPEQELNSEALDTLGKLVDVPAPPVDHLPSDEAVEFARSVELGDVMDRLRSAVVPILDVLFPNHERPHIPLIPPPGRRVGVRAFFQRCNSWLVEMFKRIKAAELLLRAEARADRDAPVEVDDGAPPRDELADAKREGHILTKSEKQSASFRKKTAYEKAIFWLQCWLTRHDPQDMDISKRRIAKDIGCQEKTLYKNRKGRDRFLQAYEFAEQIVAAQTKPESERERGFLDHTRLDEQGRPRVDVIDPRPGMADLGATPAHRYVVDPEDGLSAEDERRIESVSLLTDPDDSSDEDERAPFGD